MKTNNTECAKKIRQELKTNFPETKFSVITKESTIKISWTNGPTNMQVEKITNKYKHGYFDGMTDMYIYSNNNEETPKVLYIITSRKITKDIMLQAAQTIHSQYTAFENIPIPQTIEDLEKNFKFYDYYNNWYQICWNVLDKIDLTNAKGIKKDSNFNGGRLFDGFLPILEVQ